MTYDESHAGWTEWFTPWFTVLILVHREYHGASATFNVAQLVFLQHLPESFVDRSTTSAISSRLEATRLRQFNSSRRDHHIHPKSVDNVGDVSNSPTGYGIIVVVFVKIIIVGDKCIL
jgi:hypothetical protein